MSTIRYGHKPGVDARGATGRMDPWELPRHLSEGMSTIQWSGGGIPELVPDSGSVVDQNDILQAGQILDGKYEIRGVLGSGGMGQVFEARDLGLNRVVAVKIAWPHIGADPLRREAQVLAAFRDPALATVHALDSADGLDYLVMERISGSTLADLLVRRKGVPMPVGEGVELLESLCAALAPLHASGLAHADLKPANIMVAPGGRLVLLDFGIARIEQLSAGGRRVSGSPHYMAPEAVCGKIQPGQAHLVDLYALGVIAFVLFTGAPPFDNENPVALMMEHVHNPPPRLTDRRAEVPAALAQLVADLLAKDPADRPADVDGARADLKRLRPR
ncbi:MAG TPA: serine/threonine-protein kinase [Kofleriaceae bacterium]|nr:serine/threonine-protein kinase [Kofleriaceae bacterium]